MATSKEEPHALLDRVRPAISEYLDDPGVRVAVVTGSVATGRVDAHSDVDLILARDRPLNDDAFRIARQAALDGGGGFYGGTAAEGFGLWRMIGDVKLDVGTGLVRSTDALLDDLLERADLDLDKQLVVRGLRQAVVLKGLPVVREWRRRTDVYPEALRSAMIERFLPPVSPWVMRAMGVARLDPLLLTELRLDGVRQLTGLLYGLNRVWHPGKLKGMLEEVDDLSIAPSGLSRRLRSMVDGVDDGIEAYVDLANESLDLVEQHAPEVVVHSARARLRLDLTRTAR